MGHYSKIIIKRYFIILLLVVLAFNVKAQTDSVKQLIENKVKKIVVEARKGDPRYWEEGINVILLSQPVLTYEVLQKYESDTSQKVIRGVVEKYFMLKNESTKIKFRQDIVNRLLKIYQIYKNSQDNYNTFGIPGRLASFHNKITDFNKESKFIIKEILITTPSQNILLLIGIVGLKDQMQELKKFLPDGERYKKPGKFYFSSLEWSARIAMARLGDKEQIDFCVAKVKSVDLLENSYGYGDYMDYLIYIKKPEVLPYLFELLLANKPFRDQPIYTSSNPAIYALRELLKDFPPEDGLGLKEKGLQEYRKWVEDHKGRYKFKE